MTTKGEWVAYNGSDEQIAELISAKNVLFRGNSGGDDWEWFKDDYVGKAAWENVMTIYEYWIIPDDPLREMKIRQAQTGQTVWARRYSSSYETYEYFDVTTIPNWNIPNAEYSFTAFEE